MLIDIGVNLTSKRFQHDRAQVVHRARDAGVEIMIITGTDLQHSQSACALTQSHPGELYATAGVHPHHAKDWGSEAEQAVHALSGRRAVVAIGECGLDFNRNFSPRADQERCFQAQLELAATVGLPVFMHERDAHEAFVKILSRYRDRLPGAVVHCFTGTEAQLRAYLELDCHIGITGWICDERRGLHLHDFVQCIPDERLMVETDAPYLLPRTLKDKPEDRRNEPMYLPLVVEALAGIRGQSVQYVADVTTATARRFFRLPVAVPHR